MIADNGRTLGEVGDADAAGEGCAKIRRNMIMQSFDTDPQAEAVQIQLLRQATNAQRAAIMCSLSATVANLSRRAIRRANPTYTQLELDLAFVAYHYGEALAERIRPYLEQRCHERR